MIGVPDWHSTYVSAENSGGNSFFKVFTEEIFRFGMMTAAKDDIEPIHHIEQRSQQFI